MTSSRTDYEQFAFEEVDELREMKSNDGPFKTFSSGLPSDRGNLPNSSTSGISKRSTSSAFNNRPRGEDPRD